MAETKHLMVVLCFSCRLELQVFGCMKQKSWRELFTIDRYVECLKVLYKTGLCQVERMVHNIIGNDEFVNFSHDPCL